jgi:AbiV family abortive infection protein
VSKRGRYHRTGPPGRVLTFDRLYEGYDKSIRNAEHLFAAGTAILKDFTDVALGLFELGQEEVGKSFSFLAAFGYGPSDAAWEDFWMTWRDHKKKAYRAFSYEWLSPTRFQVVSPTGSSLDGFPLKASIEREKESAFYVDYLPATGRFMSPEEQIDSHEAANRSASLISHITTAYHVKIALDEGDKQWNYSTFGEIPKLLLWRPIRQENMTTILDRFAARSDRHQQLIENLRSTLRQGAEWLRNLEQDKSATEDASRVASGGSTASSIAIGKPSSAPSAPSSSTRSDE